MPTTDTVTVNTGGGADYTSLALALAGEATDLVSADKILLIKVAGSAADTDTVVAGDFSGYICDATRYIQIEPNTGQEHGGAWNTNVYRLESTDLSAFSLPTATGVLFHVRLRGLQIKATATTGTTTRRCISAQSGPTVNSILDVQNCILWVDKTGGTGTHKVVEIVDANWSPVKLGNCLAILSGSSPGYGFDRNTTCNMYVHNCGVVGASSTAYADSANSATGTLQLKNNWAYQCTTFSSGLGVENSDYNSTDLSTATGGANDRVSQTFTFVDAGAGDYRPASTDSAIRGQGVDLAADGNLAITADMEGIAVNSPPDIGPLNADEAAEEESENRWRIRRAAA